MTWRLHRKIEWDGSLIKEVNSGVNPMVEVIHSAPLTIGSWLGVLDMMVVPMDDQSVILG